jgi:hypothetical protein
MRRILDLRPVLAVLASLLFGCSSASMTAGELAGAVGGAFIHEEDAVLSTCRALDAGKAPAASEGADGRQRSLEAHIRKDRVARAKALLDAVGVKAVDDATVAQLLECSETGGAKRCEAALADLAPKVAAAADGDVLKVVGFSLDAKTPEEAAKVAKERLLTSLAALTQRFNFAHATVLGLVQVAQLVEGMVNDVADGFGFFKGFASPLLERVSAELIAVGMDGILAGLEKDGHVTAAAVAAHACKVYQRVDPSSQVTSRVVRRAILRFSPASYGKATGMLAACAELSRKKGGDPVCREILEDQLGVELPPSSGGDASLEAVLQPRLADQAAAAPPTAEQVRALEVASKACLEDEAREGACTLDRVTRVASVLAELGRFEGETGARFASLEARIDRFEESVSLLHGKVDRLGGDVANVRARTASLGAAMDSLRRDVADARDKVSGAEASILGALGKLPRTQCKDHIQKVIRARNELARELGVAAIDPCPLTGGSGGGTIRVYATKFTSVSVRHEELCDQRFVTVNAQVTFSQGSFECGAGCLDRGFRELTAQKIQKPGAGLVLVGNADQTPIINKRKIRDAWKLKKAEPGNASLLPEIPMETDSDDELQRILSMLRAMSVRGEIGAGSGAIMLEALGKASNRRGVDVRFVLPDVTLDLAAHCQN